MKKITLGKNLTVHCDASCYYKDGRIGLGYAWFVDDDSKPVDSRAINKHNKKGTNNEAEYLAIIDALCSLSTEELPYDSITIASDSQVVISQINGDYRINAPGLQVLYDTVHILLRKLPPITFQWVPRTHPRQRIVDYLSKKSNPYFIQKRRNERSSK